MAWQQVCQWRGLVSKRVSDRRRMARTLSGPVRVSQKNHVTGE